MSDGGFNCRLNRSGAVHNSLHSTLSVAEGIREYLMNGYGYRSNELMDAERSSREFILQHQLYLSDRTGKITQKGFIKLSYPGRWRYDILRALDYFRITGASWDSRMESAFDILVRKRRKDGSWTSSKHPGQIHFELEQNGRPSRWNTLRALRVLKHFNKL